MFMVVKKKIRLWPSLIKNAKQNKDFIMSPGKQKTDFNYIKDVIDGLIVILNFKKKSIKFPQIWELGSGKTSNRKTIC